MFIVELEYPGRHIELADPESAARIEDCLQGCERSLTEAAIALYRFEEDRATSNEVLGESEAQQEAYQADQARVDAFTKVYLKLLSDPSEPQYLWSQRFLEARSQAERHVKRQNWKAGQIPSEYLFKAPFMDAQAFISALDIVHRFLQRIKKEPGIPPEVAKHVDTFRAHFPDLKDTRDSIQHIDERMLGLAREKPMPLQLGTALAINNLSGNRLGIIAADGSIVDVEVSEQSMEQAVTCVQGVINAFTWTGDKEHYLPSWGRRFW